MGRDKSETSAADFFPDRKSLKAFREAAANCKGGDLWERGTQTVFGAGARDAEERHIEKRRFIDDLKRVAGVLSKTR